MTRRSSSKRARSRDGCVDTDSCNGMWEPVYAQQAGPAGAAEAAGALAPMLKRSRASPTCGSSTTTALTTAPWSLASVSATSSSLHNIMMTMQEQQQQQQPQQYQYPCHQADDDCGMGCEPSRSSSTSAASASSWPFQQQQEHTAVASLSTQDHSMPSTADLDMCDAPTAPPAPATAPDLSELPDAYWNEWAGQSDVY